MSPIPWEGLEVVHIDAAHVISKNPIVGPDGMEEGYLFFHMRPDRDTWCAYQRISILPPYGHTLVSTDPFHFEPSLRCTVCGDHGWIRQGRWQRA